MRKSGLIYLFVATILFSSMEVAIKATNHAFNPIQLNFLRFSIGAMVLLPMAIGQLKRSRHKIDKRDIRDFSLMGFFCVVISLSFYIISINYIPAYEVAILFSGNTFISILLAGIFLGEKISRQSKFALCISFLGMVMIINPFKFKGSLTGVLLIITSAITFSIYSVFSKFLTKGRATGGNVMTCFAFIMGCIQLGILMIISHIPFVASLLISNNLDVIANIPFFKGISSRNMILFLYISVFVTGVGFATYFLAMDTLSVAMASLVFFIKPVLSPIMAYLILGEVIPVSNILGLVLIVIGSSILFRYNLRRIKRANANKPVKELIESDVKQNYINMKEEFKRNILANQDIIEKKNKK